jgi:DNA-binding response OmpR family regulator
VLVAHLRALLRREPQRRAAPLVVGDLRVDPAGRRVWRGDDEIELTARELAVLEYLVRRQGQVVSKRDVIDHVWDDEFEGDPNIVEVYVRRLRNKIDRPYGRESIQTARGSGYRLAGEDG